MKVRNYHLITGLLLGLLAVFACRREELPVIPTPPPEEEETPPVTPVEPENPEPPDVPDPLPEEPVVVFPEDLSAPAKVYIETPGGASIASKHTWVELCSIRITGDDGEELFLADSLKVKGRGNSTWYDFPKKPYTLKLRHQANFFGTGKSKRYVLLANWMDRTLLRNDVALEAARRTSLEWTPSGTFVELYLNGRHQGTYWLGEKINVEGSKFKADYLFSFDTSDSSEPHFRTSYGFQPNTWQTGLPVEVKYPDEDDFEPADFQTVLSDASTLLNRFGEAVRGKSYAGMVDLDSFCDWYLVHELCYNLEPNHPKSCFIHVRDGVFISGPVWDFDWYTFVPDKTGLDIRNALYFRDFFSDPAFKARLKERWKTLLPEFQSLGEYIDGRASFIRSSEAVNHQMWPISRDWVVNGDEQLSFQNAVNRLKTSLNTRIVALNTAIEAL